MTLLDQIQDRLQKLPPDKQSEVLDFIEFLGQRTPKVSTLGKPRSLRNHPAFGSWQGRNIDGLKFERTLRDEWNHTS